MQFINGSEITANDILKLSKGQGATCMYTEEELETFPQEKLNNIYAAISVIKPMKKKKMSLTRVKRTKKKVS